MDVVVGRDNNIGMERCRRTIDTDEAMIPFSMPGSHCRRFMVSNNVEVEVNAK